MEDEFLSENNPKCMQLAVNFLPFDATIVVMKDVQYWIVVRQ